MNSTGSIKLSWNHNGAHGTADDLVRLSVAGTSIGAQGRLVMRAAGLLVPTVIFKRSESV